MDQVALVAFGSNQTSPAGPPTETINSALAALGDIKGLQLRSASALYSTPAFPPGSGPDFVNAVAAFDCIHTPTNLLEILHQIEADHARTRRTRWAARSLDLDLLALGKLIRPSQDVWREWYELPLADQANLAPKQLILPHPRIQERAFVLVPLADAMPQWRHPVLDKTAAEMCSELPKSDLESVKKL